MHQTQLNPSKYKRLFTFGCSFTNYHWPTWADILAEDIPYYENWGRVAAGNLFIFNSIMEAHNKHQFTNGDLIVVMWSNKDREDRYVLNDWISTAGGKLEEHYGLDWIKKFYDERGGLIRDLALIQATQLYLDTLDSDWINMSINTFANGDSAQHNTENLKHQWKDLIADLHQGNISPLFKNYDVLECYKNVFLKLKPSVFDVIQSSGKYKLTPRPNNNDLHPTPFEILEYIDIIFPNNTISDNARFYANHWQSEIWNLKTIDSPIFKTKSQLVTRL